MSWDKTVIALVDVVSKKINGSIGVEMLFVIATLFGILYFLLRILYFLDRMETSTPYLTDLKPIFQTIAISLILLIAIAIVALTFFTSFRKKP